jgi:glycosyltransferase involved in cell wall biosynthesis
MLADEGDVAGLAAALQQMIANAPVWPQMLQRGRRHIEERFDSRLQGLELAKLYGSLR